MKKLILTLTAVCSLTAYADYTSPVDLDWKVAGKNDKGARISELTITNNSADTIRAPWSLYYGSYPIYTCDTPGYKAEQISGTHHRIVAEDKSTSIAPGQTVRLRLHGWYAHQKSFFPENPYIVSTSSKGLHESPIRVKFTYTEADHKEMAAEIENYPTADRVYAHNERLHAKTQPGIYDIIPSFKSVELQKKAKPLTFTGKVSLTADPAFAKDKRIFADLLRRQGVDVSAGGVPVRMIKTARGGDDESYRITVGKDGIDIYANSTRGALNGASSVLAIIGGRVFPVELPAVEIKDEPSLGYRGLHFDVSRNFTGKENVLKIIDMMTLYKLNKLHFHLVDDEGWRLAIDGLEELTEVGSRRLQNDYDIAQYPYYGSGFDGATTGNGFYTRQDFLDILNYAKDRNIEVIPEIDMPGHSRAAINAMNYRYNRYKDVDPEKAGEYLLCDFNDASVYRGAQEYNDNVMCIALPSALKFSQKVIDEIEKMYQEAGLKLSTIHVGGDEVPEGAWLGSPLCQEYMKANNLKDTRALRDDFLYKIYKYVTPKGIRIAGWQEILTEADGKTPNKTLPGNEMLSYMWSTQPYNDMDQTSYALINAGFPVILCNVNNLYLDLAYGKNYQEPGLTWGGTVDEYSTLSMLPYDLYHSLRSIDHPEGWEVNMADGKIALKDDARKNIQGIQGQLWAETYRNFDMVQDRMMPKMFGLAERAWNPEPKWAGKEYEDFREAAAQYAARTGAQEFNRLSRMGMKYHVAAPGLKIENGRLLANSPYQEADIYYTIDGSEPTEESILWTGPVAAPAASVIKAVTVRNGQKSYTSELFVK